MEQLLFGTAGIPHSAKAKTTVDGIRRIAELGLGCMEIEFVQRVTMREPGARAVAEVASETGIRLSAHAPYYINLNAREPEKVVASQQRLYQSARILSFCGGQSVAFHAAFYLGDPPEKAYGAVKQHLEEVLHRLREENNQVWLRPEVMGRPSQFGTVDEILRLSAELEKVAPCIDFAHWHARNRINTYAEFVSVLQQVEGSLGRAALDNIHIHLSGIRYGPKGERNHLNLKEADLNYIDLLRALKDCRVKGRVICESPNLEEDALLLQEAYHKLT